MRIKNSFRNMTTYLLFQIIVMVIAFICRTVFIKLLSTEYLGLNGIFCNIISLLSLSELGIGSTIIVSLYKPLAEHDENKISKLINFFSLAYKIIAAFVFLCGIILLPFLKYLVKTNLQIPNISLIFMLFVLNSSLSYLFSYKRTIITADQKEYICTINNSIFTIVQNVLQILVLLIIKRYIAYLTIMLLCTLASNIAISIKANKLYPFLVTNKSSFKRKEIKDLIKKATAMLSHKFGRIVVNSTDNILISSMIGTVWVGLYSNYQMIINIIGSFINIIFSSISASVGNFNATEDKKRVFFLFKVMMQMSCWIYGFCAICFFVLFEEFITFWIGQQYLLNDFTVFIVIINFYIAGIIKNTKTFNNVSGLYYKTRFIPWIYVSINIIMSIILLKLYGITGVFLGTLAGCVLADFWYEPYMLYKHKFRKSVMLYFGLFIKYGLVVVIAGAITYFISTLLPYFLYNIVVCAVIPNIVFYVVFVRSKEFAYLKSSCQTILKIKIFKKN